MSHILLKVLRKTSVQSLLLLILGVLIASAYWDIRTRFVFDDAYITYRYSMNIADGYGLVWNPGHPPEEGYTSLLHVLILVMPSLFMEDPLIAAQIINIAAVISTALLVLKWGKALSENEFVPFLLSALFLFAPITWANAYSGMETSLFGLIIIVTFYVFFIKKRTDLAYFLAFACGLTRPEGFLVGGLLAMIDIYQKRSLDKSVIYFFALPLLLYAGIKTAYFGYLLPTPFIFKATLPGHGFKLFGTAYVKLFLYSVAPLFILAVASVLMSRQRELLVLLALALCLLLFYTLPAPLMGFHDRFLYSVLVILFAIAASFTPQRMWVYVPILLVVAIQGYLSFTTPRVRESLSNDHTALYKVFKDLGMILRTLPEHRAITMSTTEAGYLPFWSQLTVYDFIGLNTREFAKEKDPAKNIDRLFELKPQIITLLTVKDSGSECYKCGQIEHGMSARLHHKIPDHPSFKSYQPVTTIPFTSGVYLSVLTKREEFDRIGKPVLAALNELGIPNDSGACVVSSEVKKVVRK